MSRTHLDRAAQRRLERVIRNQSRWNLIRHGRVNPNRSHAARPVLRHRQPAAVRAKIQNQAVDVRRRRVQEVRAAAAALDRIIAFEKLHGHRLPILMHQQKPKRRVANRLQTRRNVPPLPGKLMMVRLMISCQFHCLLALRRHLLHRKPELQQDPYHPDLRAGNAVHLQKLRRVRAPGAFQRNDRRLGHLKDTDVAQADGDPDRGHHLDE